MDKKIGFKLNKNLKTLGSGLFAEDEPKESKKLFVFSEDSDELKEKMGFTGFGKIKPPKETKTNQTTAEPENKPIARETIKARQFDLEKEMGISREIAEERRSKLEQLQLDDAEDAPKVSRNDAPVAGQSDSQSDQREKTSDDPEETPVDLADDEENLDEEDSNR